MGLLPAAVLSEAAGCSGSWLILAMLVISLVSKGSNQQLSVTSILAFDVYRTYVRPNATPVSVQMVQRLLILAAGMVSAVGAMCWRVYARFAGWLLLSR